MQTGAAPPPGFVLRCARCRARLSTRAARRSRGRAAAFALGALILYPAAMLLPVLEIERLGHINEATIWSGVSALLSEGHVTLALIVFVSSIVIPLGKIAGVFALCSAPKGWRAEHQALTHRAIDFLGKWGMIDVLVVAVLVAAVKLGDWMDVHAGPGALAFAGVVLLSMAASAAFDRRLIWEEPA